MSPLRKYMLQRCVDYLLVKGEPFYPLPDALEVGILVDARRAGKTEKEARAILEAKNSEHNELVRDWIRKDNAPLRQFIKKES